MPSLAMVAAAAAGGRAVPAKPTLTHGTVSGQFQITNYDANLTYTVTATAGSATRSADMITLSNANSIGTVTARYPKSVSDSAAATAERKAYTFTMSTTNSYQHDWSSGVPGACEGYSNWGTGPAGVGGYACLDTGYNCQHTDATNVKNSTPSGYTDSYSEWWKVT